MLLAFSAVRLIELLIKQVEQRILDSLEKRRLEQVVEDRKRIPLGDGGVEAELDPWVLDESADELFKVRPEVVVMLPQLEVWLAIHWGQVLRAIENAPANVKEHKQGPGLAESQLLKPDAHLV